MESLEKNIKACITSTKEKVSVRQLYVDYRLIIGEEIPYKKYGFRTLEELIQSSPEFRLVRFGNDAYVENVQSNNSSSSHLSKMVKQQKSAKRKPPPRYRSAPQQQYNSPPKQQYNSSRWRPKTNYPSSRYQGSSRPQAVHHAQIVHRTPPKTATPSVASRVQIPEHNSNHRPVLRTVSQNMPTHDRRPVESNQKLNSNNVKTSNTLNGYLSSHYGNKATHSFSNNAPTQSKPVQNHENETTNPLMSTKKRLSAKMLNLDSGHSSPTSDIQPQSPKLLSPSTPAFPSLSSLMTPAQLSPSIPSTPALVSPSMPLTPALVSPPMPLTPAPHTFSQNEPIAFKKSMEFVKTGNPLADLKLLAERHKLGEVDVTITKMNHKSLKSKFYSCKIKIGKNTFSSYPREFSNPEDATVYCCKEALDDLIPKLEQKSLMLSSEKDILERIPPMIETHPCGVFAHQLSLNYAFKYKELLPDDWLKILDASSSVRIEKINNSHILFPCKPGDRGQQRSAGGTIIPVSVPTNTVKFSEDGGLLCFVTRVVTANEIWCQQIDTEESNNYAEMIDRMQVYYQEHEYNCIPERILEGAYYVAKFDKYYYRVRLLEIKEDNLECFFIDSGDESLIPNTDLFTLTNMYATCQAQAFVCRLAGLEDLYEISANSHCLETLQDQHVSLELASDVTNNDDDQMVLPVYMYDVATGSCINENLIPTLTMEVATPILQPDITEVHISYIEDIGNVYVQIQNRAFTDLVKLKGQIESQFNVNPPTNFIQITKANCRDKLFFKQYEGNWCRVKVIDWSPEEIQKAQIYFVDDGRTEVIDTSKEKLYPLEKINDILNNYPHQAIRVRMGLDTIPANFKALAEKVLPLGHSVLLKCVGTKVEDIPIVKLYKRNDDGGLFCINESIALECELSNKKEEEQKHKFKFLGGTDHVPCTGSLKFPKLKGLGSVKAFFEVKVIMPVNPCNFIVQPCEYEKQLNDMMEQLQIKCAQQKHGNIKVEDIIPGNIYASKHEDGIWYRTNVIKVINSGTSVSVYFCDFGYYQTLSVDNIVPLDSEFMELPYLGLKAKLAGIKPTHSNWTMENCESFKELVEGKTFYTTVVEMEKDPFCQSDIVLSLMLVDTSTEDDYFIAQELINLGIAVTDKTV